MPKRGQSIEVGLNRFDATLDVLVSGGLLTSLSQGIFRERSAVRANVGAKAGRYYFEVKVLEKLPEGPHVLILGFTSERSSLILSPESLAFDSEGRAGGGAPLGQAKRMGLVLDAENGCAQVVVDGQLKDNAQLPQGQAWFPTLTFQNVTLGVSFSTPGPDASEAFGRIAPEHCVQGPQATPQEVILPIYLPGAGDWSLRYREARPHVLEIGQSRHAERAKLLDLARLSQRSIVYSHERNLLEAERRRILANFPAAKKTAVVVFGDPSEDSSRSVEAAEEKLPLNQCCLPSQDEGFHEIRYEFVDQEAAQKLLDDWVQAGKAREVVDLTPGQWFLKKFEDWKQARKVFQSGQRAFSERSRKDERLSDVASSIELEDVKDPHNADGNGNPIYGSFGYEDWMVLSWRYELHLLCHAFIMDADRQGLPEEHLDRYWRIYYHHHFEPRKLGASDLQGLLKLLKEPVQLQGNPRMLVSCLDKDATIEEFVLSVEGYRRDRSRRIEAGDESAALSIPRPAKAAGPPKAVEKPGEKLPPKAPEAKQPAAKHPAPKQPAAKHPAPKQPVAKHPAAKQPVAKHPAAKQPLAKQPVAKQPAKQVAKLPAKQVAKLPGQTFQANAGVKRPLLPNGPLAKRPRPDGAATKLPP